MKTSLSRIFLISLGIFGGVMPAADQVNIVLLFADDLGRYASIYADPRQPSPNDIISTPVFDRVARDGARFDNAFVSVPSCTPSRAALNTGRHFFRNGSHAQLHYPWVKTAPDPFAKIKGMPLTLRDGGYHIGLTYKLHMRPSIIGGKKNTYNKAGNRFNQFSQVVSKAKNQDAAKQLLFDEVRNNFLSFLKKRDPGQAFFYSYNPTNTHRKWVRGSGKALWGIDPDQLEGRLPPFLPDTAVVREDFADYLGEAMAFDVSCGVILDEIEKLGELDNTLIVISGDHGIPGFPRGKCNVHDFGSRVLLAMRWPKHISKRRVVKTPVSLIDLAPTFLAAAGLKSVDDPNGENLLPALAAGGSDTQLRGSAVIGREVHAHTARNDNQPYPVRALRTPDFLYVKNFKPERWPAGDPYQVTADSEPSFAEICLETYACFADIDASPTKAWLVKHRRDADIEPLLEFAWNKRPAEELYELAKDPFQIHNLASDPAYAGIRNELRKQLMEELEANEDPRLDGDSFDRPPYRWERKNLHKARIK